MHPLFLAHLVSDFLLQPTWLVRWKTNHWTGVAAHASVHIAVSALLLIPNRLSMVFVILGIGAMHGIIDHLKINWQRRRPGTFTAPFLLDQLAHGTVLIMAVLISPPSSFWQIPFLMPTLLAMSFGVGAWNISRKKGAAGVAILTVTFLTFILASRLFAISFSPVL